MTHGCDTLSQTNYQHKRNLPDRCAAERVTRSCQRGRRARPGGQYYGPDGFRELRGHPVVVVSSKRSHDAEIQRRLWTVSEELTGVTFDVA
jgi:hypothetical protein